MSKSGDSVTLQGAPLLQGFAFGDGKAYRVSCRCALPSLLQYEGPSRRPLTFLHTSFLHWALSGQQGCDKGAVAQQKHGRYTKCHSFLWSSLLVAEGGRQQRSISLLLHVQARLSLPALIVPWWGKGESKPILLAWWGKGELKPFFLPCRCRRKRRLSWCCLCLLRVDQTRRRQQKTMVKR